MSCNLPDTGFVRLRQIIGDSVRGVPAVVPVAKSTWWAWVASGKAPQPIRLGERTTVWKVEDIRAFLATGLV